MNIREVVFDPNTKAFRLQFARGGSATLRVETLDIERQVLDVTLDPVADLPFAALRSMFVTEINNDVAHLGWRLKGAQSWERTPIMDFAAPARSRCGPEGWCRRATTPARLT